MNIKELIADIEKVAHTAAAVIPGAGLIDAGIGIAGSIIGLIDKTKQTFGASADVSGLDAARHALETSVSAQEAAENKELRGN